MKASFCYFKMSKKKLFDFFLTIFTFNLLFAAQLCNGFMSSEQQNRLYSEGGSYSTKQENDKSSTAGIAEELEMEQEYEQPNLYTESFQEERQRQRLANIVDQLRQQNVYNQQYNAAPLFEENEDKPFLNPEEPRLRNRNAEELEELRRLGMELKQISEEKIGEEMGGDSEGTSTEEEEEELTSQEYYLNQEKEYIKYLLNKGELIKDLLSKISEKDKRFEILWETFVEEGSNLKDLILSKNFEKEIKKQKNNSFEEIKVYKKLIEIGEKSLEIIGKKEKLKENKNYFLLNRLNESEKILTKLLKDKASGEFILGQKEHKLIWLNKLGRALDYFEKNILAFKKLNETKKPSKMATPVKKGQNEFVEFAEPISNQNLNSKRIKDIEWMEKRLPSDSSYFDNQRRGGGGPFHFFNASGNILFIAYLTICCVGVVAGVVGGVYYYNHVRSSNVDDPFNEFTRYSPSGPGKDKFSKRGGGGAQAFGQTVGDDTLAYKAQLQQYQQQKQKILGAGQTISNDQMSDNEEENDELEHNFSVFECPGLAPTGDVEIQNPNFVGENGENNTTTKNIENSKKEERND
ncbi:unnamed protein product [Meloidogyne enterolobii]|uniref:Uncharacterized protein n=1 Tax=Meloidogyne enterolobii TaxID=390850 RepID=A0ACB0ZTV2_MELEN